MHLIFIQSKFCMKCHKSKYFRMIFYDKLKLDEMKIPDPLKLNNGWLDEEEGMPYWPIVSTYYIIQFLMIDSDVEDLSDYKGSKAYSYLKQGWLSNNFYHSLGSSKYCLLKSDCHPSDRLGDSLHKLWVCLSKNEGKLITNCPLYSYGWDEFYVQPFGSCFISYRSSNETWTYQSCLYNRSL